MRNPDVSRRTLLKGGGAALAGLTVLRVAGPAQALPGQQEKVPLDDDLSDSAQAFVHPGGQVIPWLDQPPPNPVPQITGNLLKWEELDSFLTPADDFFYVQHYGLPDGLDEARWRVGIGGLVAHPQSLALEDLKARPVHEVNFTLECSGNADTSTDFFFGGIGTARWGGARLAPLLEKAGLLDGASEVVFWGVDSGTVTIRDNEGIVRAGRTGTVETDSTGFLDLTITEQFARSMSLDEALHPDNILCYQMNGEALPPKNGFPVRLIAPGWYGVANVKWLTRIEVTDHRYAGRFMARNYVQVREEERDGQTLWTFATVSHERLKSAPAKVIRVGSRYFVVGVAWGAPIASVEVRIDDGPWTAAKLSGDPPRRKKSRGYAWRFWIFDWGTPKPGEHQITSRAFDVDGNMQPAPDDPFLASKVTYWERNGHISRRVLIS
jgi:DMSO/TMAO reductase YedYZ molybdopterin-dependent catalytic subunit